MGVDETEAAWRAAFADRDTAAVRALLGRDDAHRVRVALLQRGMPRGGLGSVELHGLLLAGGGGLPLPDGLPWKIPAEAEPSEAVRHIWAPVADRCPTLVDALSAEVFGLAVATAGGEWLLGYVYLAERDGEPLGDLARLPGRPPHEHLDILWGTAPTRLGPDDVAPVLAESLPPGVRELAAVHSALFCSDTDLSLDRFSTTHGAAVRDDHIGEDPDAYDPGDEFPRAAAGDFDRWVRFCGSVSACEEYFLDMADREADGTPRIASSGMDGTSEPSSGTPFWRWIDDVLPELLFEACR